MPVLDRPNPGTSAARPLPGKETQTSAGPYPISGLTSRQTRSKVPAIAFVFALGLFVPAWHVVSTLLSDSYMTLYSGRWIAQHGIPHYEVFTVAARGRSWIDQQWLADLTNYEVWKMGGYQAVALLSAAMIGLSYAILAALMLRRGSSVVVALSCSAIALVVGLPGMFIRSQILALALFALLLALCVTDAERQRPGRRLVLVLPLLVLWANIHGSVLMGAGIATAYLVYRAWGMGRRRLWQGAGACGVLAAAALLTPLATPYGLQIIHYYGELLGNSAIASASPEWRPPAGLSFLLFAVLVGLVLGSATVQMLKRRRPPVVLGALAAATGAATAMASRNEVWFAMAAALLVADAAKTWLPTQEPARGFIAIVSTAALGLATLGTLTLTNRSTDQYQSLTPLRAIAATAAYAAAHPCVRILGDNDASSALLWLDPSLAGRVAFDARLEQYPEPVLDRWISFQLADERGWRATTRGYQILVGSSMYSPALVHRLKGLPGGVALAEDAKGVAVLTGVAARECTMSHTAPPA